MLKLEAIIVGGSNEATQPQDNDGGNSSRSIINMLKGRISFLEDKFYKKDTIIDYLSNELISSKRSKTLESTNSSRSANIYESIITVENYASYTVKETEKTAMKNKK